MPDYDYGDGYMLVYIKQNALNFTLKLCEFHCTNYFIIYLTKEKQGNDKNKIQIVVAFGRDAGR